jgi:hypothetical protein
MPVAFGWHNFKILLSCNGLNSARIFGAGKEAVLDAVNGKEAKAAGGGCQV